MKRRIKIFGCILVLTVFSAFAQKQDMGGKGVRTRSFDVKKGGRVEITIRLGDIVINPWEKNEVAVSVEGIHDEHLDLLKMSQSADTIHVDFHPLGNMTGGRGRFSLHVPEDFDINLKTLSGDLTLTGAIKGDVTGQTSNGAIRVDHISGAVEMSTASGAIKIGTIQGNGRFSTSRGDIEVRTGEGDLELKTSSGNVQVGEVRKRLIAHTSAGSLDIGSVGGGANISTGGGDILVKNVFGDSRLRTSGGDIDLGRASGTIEATTLGGDMRLGEVTGSVRAKTAEGNITAGVIPVGMGESSLKAANGVIVLAVPADARISIDALIRMEGRSAPRRRKYEVRSDFSVHQFKKDGDDELTETFMLNGGGARISLETINSNIEIRKMK